MRPAFRNIKSCFGPWKSVNCTAAQTQKKINLIVLYLRLHLEAVRSAVVFTLDLWYIVNSTSLWLKCNNKSKLKTYLTLCHIHCSSSHHMTEIELQDVHGVHHSNSLTRIRQILCTSAHIVILNKITNTLKNIEPKK